MTLQTPPLYTRWGLPGYLLQEVVDKMLLLYSKAYFLDTQTNYQYIFSFFLYENFPKFFCSFFFPDREFFHLLNH